MRLIAATHRDLSAEIRRGRFHQDLFYRLYVLPYQLPTLAQRQEDIVPLAQYFLQRQACGSPAPLPTTLAAAAAEKLCDHDWPGNVRELQHVITRAAICAAICAAGTQLQAADIQFAAPATATPRLPTPAPLDVWQRRQQHRILQALRQASRRPSAPGDPQADLDGAPGRTAAPGIAAKRRERVSARMQPAAVPTATASRGPASPRAQVIEADASAGKAAPHGAQREG